MLTMDKSLTLKKKRGGGEESQDRGISLEPGSGQNINPKNIHLKNRRQSIYDV